MSRGTQLQVLVVTMAHRLPHIDMRGYPPCVGVEYILSVQNPEGGEVEIPKDISRRDDISIIIHRDSGITRNRNHAIAAASAPYVLMADDDLSYTTHALQEIIEGYRSHPHADYILWRIETPEKRAYPNGGPLTKWPRHYHPVSVEFSFRLDAFRRSGLRWNELAGIGAPYLICGEEELMFRDLLHSSMKGEFINHSIATHTGPTTSDKFASSAAFLRSKGAIMHSCRGPAGALLRLPIEAMRSKAPTLRSLRWLAQGYIYACRNSKSL